MCWVPYCGCLDKVILAQKVKNLPVMQETRVQSPGWEVPLEKEIAIHFSILGGELHGQRNLSGYSPWDRKELDTSARLTHTHMQTQGTQKLS